MEQMILVGHLLVVLAIIGLILLQQGKGAEMGASFGAGASQTLFGSDGSGNVLTKATALLVAVFFATSFGLAIIATNKADTAIDDIDIPLPKPKYDVKVTQTVVNEDGEEEQVEVDPSMFKIADPSESEEVPVVGEPEASVVDEDIPPAAEVEAEVATDIQAAKPKYEVKMTRTIVNEDGEEEVVEMDPSQLRIVDPSEDAPADEDIPPPSDVEENQ